MSKFAGYISTSIVSSILKKQQPSWSHTTYIYILYILLVVVGPTTSVLAVQLPICCRCFVSPMISLSVVDWGWFPDSRSSKFALICSHEKCPLPHCWPMLESHRKHQVILISRASWRFSPQIRSAASMTPRNLHLLKIGDLQDPTDGDLRIFVPYVWRHICCSYLQLRRWWIGPYMFLAIYVVDFCSYLQLRSGPYWTSIPRGNRGHRLSALRKCPAGGFESTVAWWFFLIIPWSIQNAFVPTWVSQVESWAYFINGLWCL